MSVEHHIRPLGIEEAGVKGEALEDAGHGGEGDCRVGVRLLTAASNCPRRGKLQSRTPRCVWCETRGSPRETSARGMS